MGTTAAHAMQLSPLSQVTFWDSGHSSVIASGQVAQPPAGQAAPDGHSTVAIHRHQLVMGAALDNRGQSMSSAFVGVPKGHPRLFFLKSSFLKPTSWPGHGPADSMDVDEDTPEVKTRVLCDAMHGMSRVTKAVSLVHPLRRIFVSRLRDAFFEVNQDDFREAQAHLRSKGWSPDRIALAYCTNYKWFLQRCAHAPRLKR